MIKTQAYNDFTSFSYEERRDPTFMFEQLKSFTENGGDASLMVKLDNYGDKTELYTFKDYVMKHIKNPEDFLTQLMNAGILPSVCSFYWNPNEKSITESKDFGLKWMSQNYDEFKDIIQQSIKKLINDLPSDLTQVEIFKGYDYYGQIEVKKHNHPIFEIAEAIHKEEIYDIIFSAIPSTKSYWEENNKRRGEEQPRFLNSIESIWNEVKKPGLGIVFYKHGIGVEYMHKEENASKLHDLICYASYSGDIDFLNTVLPKVNLPRLEANKYPYNLSLPRAKNAEIVKKLLAHNAVIEQEIESRNSSSPPSQINILFSEEMRKVEVFDTILENTDYGNQVCKEPKSFYGVMLNKDFDFTKTLIEKYNFPLEKFDMLQVAWKHDDDDEQYQWLIKNGADPRNCQTFCESIVNSRESGLKRLRALNKQGILMAKSPDVIYGIFSNSPTKNFITYYEKLTANELEKNTKNNFPAWWSATSQNDFKFMMLRIDNPAQTASDGRPYLHFILEKELHTKVASGFARESFKTQLDYIKRKCPDSEIDFSYRDNNGNNVLHHLVTVKKYGKDSIDTTLFDNLKEYTNNRIYDLFSIPNNAGITPLEILLTQEMRSTWSSVHLLEKIVTEGNINYNQTLSTGEQLSEKMTDYLKDRKEFLPQLQSAILNSKLEQKLEVKPRRAKI